MRSISVLLCLGAAAPFVLAAACSSDPDPAAPAAIPDSGKGEEPGMAPEEDSAPPVDATTKDAKDAAPTFKSGEIDKTFGTNGITQVLPISFAWQPQTGLVLADDRIVIAGVGNDSGGANHDIVVGRFDAEGQPIPNAQTSSFDYATHAPWELGDLGGAVETPAGSVVFFGTASQGSEVHGYLEQHDLASGTCNWGPDCWAFSIAVAATQSHLQVNAVAVTSTGELIVGGAGTSGGNADFMLSKLAANGAAVGTFGGGAGTNGTVATDFGGNESITLLAPQKDTTLLAVGIKPGGANSGVVMARYSAAGVLDTTFGTAGKVLTGKKSERLVTLSDGKILGVHQDSTGVLPKTAFTRFLATGETDPSFGVDGVLLADWPTAENTVTAVAIQADGHILVGYHDFTIARFTGGGTLDTSWGTGGYVTVPDVGTLVALGFQQSGKVVAMGGKAKAGGMTEMMVAVRMHP